MNDEMTICPKCGTTLPQGAARCPLCGMVMEKILPIYIYVDMAINDQDLMEVQDGLNILAVESRKISKIWSWNVCLSVVTVGETVDQVVPLTLCRYFQPPCLTPSRADPVPKGMFSLSYVAVKVYGVDLLDRRTLWKRKLHAPVAIIIADVDKQCSEDRTKLSFIGDLSDDSLFDDLDRWNFEGGIWRYDVYSPESFKQSASCLYDRIDTWLDMEADAVPEWYARGWDRDDDV